MILSRQIRITLTALFVGPFLVACAGGPDLAKTKKMSISGNGVKVVFNEALHREYLNLATLEDDESDTEDAHFFNNKAMNAAMAKKVGPQPIKERKLPGDTKWELTAARSALMAELGSGAITYHPVASARAQAMFDCWMQEQEENDQPKDIARCRVAFDKALTQISARPAPMPAPVAAPKPTPKPMVKTPVPLTYVVFFDFNSTAFSKSTQAIIGEAIKDARRLSPERIGILGHTDRSGSNKYNVALSKKRAEAVKQALVAGGVSPAILSPAFLGEDDPAFKTPDGVRSASNRRVHINFE